MTIEVENPRELALKDVIGKATDEESAWLCSDARVREWYACLKQLRQDRERELGEGRRATKLTHHNDAYATKEDELGLEISEINGALSEAREVVKDLNVRETAAQANRKAPVRPATVPPPANSGEDRGPGSYQGSGLNSQSVIIS